MEVDDIISYHDVVTAEKASLQKGMNYGVGKNYSVFLMSLRENAPYADLGGQEAKTMEITCTRTT